MSGSLKLGHITFKVEHNVFFLVSLVNNITIKLKKYTNIPFKVLYNQYLFKI